MGPCIAGGAYLPALSDVIIMVEGTSFMGLGGPNLVKGATGQVIDSEPLGGAAPAHRGQRRRALPGEGRLAPGSTDPRAFRQLPAAAAPANPPVRPSGARRAHDCTASCRPTTACRTTSRT